MSWTWSTEGNTIPFLDGRINEQKRRVDALSRATLDATRDFLSGSGNKEDLRSLFSALDREKRMFTTLLEDIERYE